MCLAGNKFETQLRGLVHSSIEVCVCVCMCGTQFCQFKMVVYHIKLVHRLSIVRISGLGLPQDQWQPRSFYLTKKSKILSRIKKTL